MPVSTASGREKRRASAPRKKKKKKINALLLWWPLLLGIAVTPFAIHAASIMALEGPAALRTLYPYVVLLKDPTFGFSNDLGNNLSQWMMYLQFPLYGAIMALILRSKNVWIAFAAAAATHFAALFAVFMIAHLHSNTP